jgi:subtilisin
MSASQRFIILPPLGVRLASAGVRLVHRALPLEHFMAAIARPRQVAKRDVEGATVKVLDSIHEDGAKLVEMRPEDVMKLRTAQPGVRVVPEVFFRPARAPRPQVHAAAAASARRTMTVTLRVISRAGGKPVAGADVIAFTDREAGEGGQGRTDAAGRVRLRLRAAARKVERLFVFPAFGFWGALGKNVVLKPEMTVALRPIDLGTPDLLRQSYGLAPLATGRAVTVGIVDTGVGDHPDLVVAGGANSVRGEKQDDWRDNGAGHGTHVAGIVAARGMNGRGVRGLAPGVRLRSYRVFGKGAEGASNYSILKALDRALADGCDLVNISLGGPDQDEATRSAIIDARAQGTLVVCAAGNDGRGPVSYPAAEQLAIAVSAMGRKGTFPADSTHAAEIMAPYGKDRASFIAAFSNVGHEIDLTGPGVAIVSTVPGGYAAWDGTSMACPAVTGAAAALLARERRALRMVRGQARSDEMARLVYAAARALGFGVRFEGRGML